MKRKIIAVMLAVLVNGYGANIGYAVESQNSLYLGVNTVSNSHVFELVNNVNDSIIDINNINSGIKYKAELKAAIEKQQDLKKAITNLTERVDALYSERSSVKKFSKEFGINLKKQLKQIDRDIQIISEQGKSLDKKLANVDNLIKKLPKSWQLSGAIKDQSKNIKALSGLGYVLSAVDIGGDFININNEIKNGSTALLEGLNLSLKIIEAFAPIPMPIPPSNTGRELIVLGQEIKKRNIALLNANKILINSANEFLSGDSSIEAYILRNAVIEGRALTYGELRKSYVDNYYAPFVKLFNEHIENLNRSLNNETNNDMEATYRSLINVLEAKRSDLNTNSANIWRNNLGEDLVRDICAVLNAKSNAISAIESANMALKETVDKSNKITDEFIAINENVESVQLTTDQKKRLQEHFQTQQQGNNMPLKYTFRYDDKSNGQIPILNSGKKDDHINLASNTITIPPSNYEYFQKDQFVAPKTPEIIPETPKTPEIIPETPKTPEIIPETPKTTIPAGGFGGTWYSIPYGNGNDIWKFDSEKKTFSLLAYGTDGNLWNSFSGTFDLTNSSDPSQMKLNVLQVNKTLNNRFFVGDTLYGIFQYDDINQILTVQAQEGGQQLKFFTGKKEVLIRTATNSSTGSIEGTWRIIHPGDSDRIATVTLGNGYTELYFTDLSGYIHSGFSGIPTYSVKNGRQTLDIKITSVFGGEELVHVGDTVYGIYQKNGNDLSFAISFSSTPSSFVYNGRDMNGIALSNMVTSSKINFDDDFIQKNIGSIIGVEESDNLSLWSQNGLILGDNNTQTIKNNDTVVLSIYGKQVSSKAIVDSGYQYTAWGEWSEVLPSPSPSEGYWVAGKAPDIDVLAARKGKASYSGNVIGDYSKLPATIMHGAITGGIKLTADFDQQIISGNMSLSNNGVAYANPYFNSTKITTVEGSQTAFSASLNEKSGGNGSISGCLYGPMGQEAGGQFQYRHTDGSRANGIFRAKE